MYKITNKEIEGCVELIPTIFQDHRGKFVKTMVNDEFIKINLNTNFEEEFYTLSKQGVLRGLHFQNPPYEHDKLVYCPYGEIYDVVFDLRSKSPSYGKFSVNIINSELGNMLYIPKGVAHGFCTLSKDALVMYKVNSKYSPQHDMGILWSSINLNWPIKNPIISERDKNFKSFDKFISEF